MKKENGVTDASVRMPIRNLKDVSNRNIFKDPLLCIQFLRDYVDSGLFENINPEDIIDESEKYQAYLGVEFETDTVKKICFRGKHEDVPMYMISLVEHKSWPDYNVSMQLLRYMVCIWNEYGREVMSRGEGNIANKSFRYPPILPVVYYEGTDKWTVPMHFKERIFLNDIYAQYIPDFTYKLVNNQNYTNEELLANEDEMSLLMMLGRAQSPETLHELLDSERQQVERILRKAPEHVLELIASTVWSLCMKLNMPEKEAEECVKKVRERQMGYWFENMQKMDIQEERRKTAEARKERELACEEAEKAKEYAKKAKEEAERTKEEAERTKKEAERTKAEMKAELDKVQQEAWSYIIHLCKEFGMDKEEIKERLMERCGLDAKTAGDAVDYYYNN